jgi:putative oxidoreductase
LEEEQMDSLATGVQGLVSLLARLMLVAIFMLSALGNKIPQFSATVDYMASEGVPQPRLALFGAIALLLLGGLSVISGAWTRIGASFLLVFLAAATFYFHDFWTYVDPSQDSQQQVQLIHFMKNVAIGGGLLMLVSFGAGPWSVDGWISTKEAEAAGAGQRPRRSASKEKNKDRDAEE